MAKNLQIPDDARKCVWFLNKDDEESMAAFKMLASKIMSGRILPGSIIPVTDEEYNGIKKMIIARLELPDDK